MNLRLKTRINSQKPQIVLMKFYARSIKFSDASKHYLKNMYSLNYGFYMSFHTFIKLYADNEIYKKIIDSTYL